MKLHPPQSEVAIDNHDYRVVCCGRQWGKTTLAVLEMIAYAFAKGGREIAYFATTYDQARNIAWTILKDATRNAWAKPPNESRLELHISTQDEGESRITLRGFENVETARGQQFDFLVIDEVAQMRNWKYIWNAVLEPTLAFRHGKALFISTPLGFNHFYDLYNLGQTDNPIYKSWRFTSYDNPYLDPKRIEQAKKTSTEDYFAQEYMADFRKATGLAHKYWDRDINVITPFEVPKEWARGRGVDYGSTHPTASLRIAVDNDDNWFIERCYKDNKRSIKEHAEALLSQDYNLLFIPKYGDPTGSQWFTEFDQHNFHIEPANKEVGQGARGWVEYCVEAVNQRLKPIIGHTIILPNNKKIENAPKLFLFNTEENKAFISEIELLKWRSTTEGGLTPILDEDMDPNGHFDLMAALRYLTVSYKKPVKQKPITDFGGVKSFYPGIG